VSSICSALFYLFILPSVDRLITNFTSVGLNRWTIWFVRQAAGVDHYCRGELKPKEVDKITGSCRFVFRLSTTDDDLTDI
jgi:hypothetical protein